MSKAEKFINDCTRNCSNVFINPQLGGTEENHPWLTPDQARKAVEIAREEIFEWLNEKLPIYIHYKCRGVGESVEEFVDDLKQAMKDE